GGAGRPGARFVVTAMARREAHAGEVRSGLSRLASAAAWIGYMFLILPSLVVIPLSFGSSNEMVFPPGAYSLEQYRKYFLESTWMSSTLLSVRVGLVTCAVSLLVGVPAAYGLVRGNFRFRRFMLVFLLAPVLVPVIVIALGLYLYLS